MPDSTVFRTKVIEAEPVADAPLKELEPGISGSEVPTGALDPWQTDTKEYVSELFGIKEVSNEFPYRMQVGALDKYIKAEIAERGWNPDNKHYQQILEELVGETGTEDTEVFEKMKRLYDYIQVVNKYNALKKKKDAFRSMSSGSGL